MIAASFCPFRTRSGESIRLINESGPEPSRTGRYIGSFAVCDEPTSTCDHPRRTIDNSTATEIPKTRMETDTQPKSGRFSTVMWRKLCCGRPSLSGGLVHHGMPAEVGNHRVAGQHMIKRAIRRRSLEEGLQFQETMSSAAGIEAVKRD